MIVVGGVTRLTHSGLSITEWQPIVGTLPPLSRRTGRSPSTSTGHARVPQVNRGMSLEAFKGIFWWEYFHRLLGRLIGVAFLVPFSGSRRRRIPAGYGWKLAGMFALGGLQGAMGWFMVQSGLVADPRVSQFRLTAHLGLAFVILGRCCGSPFAAASASRGAGDPAARSARRWSFGIVALVLRWCSRGGFVAGIRAGFAYNTFPLMNGAWIPPEILMLEPAWTNFFWNMATVQFDHRVGAWLLFFLVPVLWWKLRTRPTAAGACGERRQRAARGARDADCTGDRHAAQLVCRCRSRRCTRPARRSSSRRGVRRARVAPRLRGQAIDACQCGPRWRRKMDREACRTRPRGARRRRSTRWPVT